jgi:ankyrin repeat protein
MQITDHPTTIFKETVANVFSVSFTQGGRTPLHLAALQGHTHLVKLLEGAGADVRAADEHGMTPLHKAAVQGHSETVADLLAHGAHVDAKLTVRPSPTPIPHPLGRWHAPAPAVCTPQYQSLAASRGSARKA